MTTLYREEFPKLLADADDMEGVELGEITVGALNVGEIGEDRFAYRITVPISIEGFTVEVVADLVAVRAGRAASLVTFASFFGPTPIERITEYTTLAASRLPG